MVGSSWSFGGAARALQALPLRRFAICGCALHLRDKTPGAVVARWNELANEALSDPALRDKIRA
jgi:hypothetical protein